MKHTEGKWEVFNNIDIFGENDQEGRYHIADCSPDGYRDNNPHCNISCDEMQANAAFIVEAVNSHASLKAKAYWLNQRNTVFVDAMAELVCGYLAELDNISKEVEG